MWERELLHQATNGLGISGGIIHGQALDQLCLCIEQAAVFLQTKQAKKIGDFIESTSYNEHTTMKS